MTRARAEEVGSIVDAIAPLIGGRPPELQGAVLADLLAIWLAGHIHLDGKAATERLRAGLLDDLVECVKKLVPVNEAIARRAAQ